MDYHTPNQFIQQNEETILSNINSPVLKLSSEGKNDLNSITEKDSWKKVARSYEKVLLRKFNGDFGIDPVKFYAMISSTVDNVNNILTNEFTYVREKLIRSSITDVKEKITFISISLALSLIGVLL